MKAREDQDIPAKEADPVSSARQDAEMRKLIAETMKLESETAALRRSGLTAVSEWVKIVGGVILGLGGLFAAITQYQLSEVKKENAQLAVRLAEQEKRDLEQRAAVVRATLNEQRSSVLRAVAALQQEPHEPIDVELAENGWARMLMHLEVGRASATAADARLQVVLETEEYASWLAAKILRVAKTKVDAVVASRLLQEKKTTSRQSSQTSDFDLLLQYVLLNAKDKQDWGAFVRESAQRATFHFGSLTVRIEDQPKGTLQKVRYVQYVIYAVGKSKQERLLASYIAQSGADVFKLFVLGPRISECSSCLIKFTAVDEAGNVLFFGDQLLEDLHLLRLRQK